MQLSELWVYPIKSLGGFSLPEALVQIRGLQYDRRWMLVDEQGKFVTQREIPAMALLGTALEPPYLLVFPKKNRAECLRIPLAPSPETLEKVQVEVWSARCAARLLPTDINDWFSQVLGQPLRLVQMPDTTYRAADGRYAPKKQYVSFADGFPYLLIGQASLDDLNTRLAQPLPMNRFRPNLIFSGGAPFAEDGWREFQLGDARFQCVKPCARCIIPTTDQETAARTDEPLKTLATYRKVGRNILFGQNVVWLGEQEPWLRVGMEINLL